MIPGVASDAYRRLVSHIPGRRIKEKKIEETDSTKTEKKRLAKNEDHFRLEGLPYMNYSTVYISHHFRGINEIHMAQLIFSTKLPLAIWLDIPSQ